MRRPLASWCATKRREVSRTRIPIPIVPFDFEAAVQASLEQKALEDAAPRAMEKEMQASLSKFSETAAIDRETPKDGSCLFHALRAGGLFSQRALGDVRLSTRDLRKMAVNEASDQQVAIAAASNDPSMSVDDYREGMRNGEWGDNLMLACLSRAFNRAITVISKDTARTFLPDGESPGVLEDAAWVAHYSEVRYFGVKRGGEDPEPDAGPRKRLAGKQRGTSFEVRLRQDRIGKTQMARRAQRLGDNIIALPAARPAPFRNPRACQRCSVAAIIASHASLSVPQLF
ncbi:unnamed protein product [Prorocentrum cordatum]|uniref:OTU domain-containing protein n=2 Tax=Prorocentrum cordatum TaxID=2364126 RepID=A0ABN9UJK2_9DINO|nr:unnamed protein product [Polarella glacialis]